MSEPTQKRTSGTIQQEYSNVIFSAGQLQYEIEVKKKDLAMKNSTLQTLALEYTKVQGEEVKEAQLKAKLEAEFKAKQEAVPEQEKQNAAS